MKTRTLSPDNITKVFRKFDGSINVQIDNKRWITLSEENSNEDIQRFMSARNLGSLESITLDGDCLIVQMKINPYKNTDKDLLDKVKKIYKHN